MYKIFLLLLSSTLCAQCPDTCVPVNCAYLPSARRCVATDDCPRRLDAYFSVDFLYWEGTERGLEYALKNTASFFDQHIQLYEPDFSFNPAFRIGIGTHLAHDNWDLEFSYTRYNTHTSNRAHHAFIGPQNSGIHAVWTSSIAFQGNNFRALWQEAKAQWKLHSNFFDLLLKHRLCLSSAITIEPAFGLKLALLQQSYSVIYDEGNTVPVLFPSMRFTFNSSTIAMKNRSLNLGPTLSLTSKWNLSNHFDLLGTLTGSLLASHFNVGRNEYNVGQNADTDVLFIDSIRQGDEYWALRPQAAISLGFGWSNCTYRSQRLLHYGWSATYEAQVWWKQNMLFRFIDQTNAAMLSPTQGNLFFHGLTLDAFLDF